MLIVTYKKNENNENRRKMNKRPLTTGKAAEYCHVTYRTVLKWIEKGKLQSYRTPGGHHRVQTEDFLRFLKKHNMPIPSTETDRVIQRKRILIVDDNKNMVNSIKRVLRAEKRYQIDQRRCVTETKKQGE